MKEIFMGNRLSKITTRTGDDGSTGLADGTRLPKTAPVFAAMGDVDELNSWLGLLLAELPHAGLPDPLAGDLGTVLTTIQHDLFDLGGELSMPGVSLIKDAHLQRLDALVEQFNAELPALKEFILPGGSRVASLAHLARAVCRRAERSVLALEAKLARQPRAMYLNRLSDWLFILARTLARASGGEILWRGTTR